MTLVIWAVFLCISSMLGFLASFRPLPLYESDRIEGWFISFLLLFTDVDYLRNLGP